MKHAKTELVLPGGDLERAKIALDYGADAVYVGLNKYSLRKGEVRFDIPEIGKAIEYAHRKGKKLYVTFNIFAHNEHLAKLEKDLKKIAKYKPDAFIIANVGVMQVAKRVTPNVPLHISTQANTTNIEDVRFWSDLGAKRVVLARELSLTEIKNIHQAIPEIELEVFAHGSMCISYSGRCLLSNYMTGRHANLGDCAQPCRWNYKIASSSGPRAQGLLEEEQRPGEYFQIEETDGGTNIMSSKDLCTIEHIDEMIEAGVHGFKVEGRNKTEYYLAATALAYREALDLSRNGKYAEKDKKRLKQELKKLAHRGYTNGFLFGEAKKGETYEGRSPIQEWSYVGMINSSLSLRGENRRGNLDQHTGALDDNWHNVTVKNKLQTGMNVEVLTPQGIEKDKVLGIFVDEESVTEISPGKQNQTARITLTKSYPPNSLLRTKA